MTRRTSSQTVAVVLMIASVVLGACGTSAKSTSSSNNRQGNAASPPAPASTKSTEVSFDANRTKTYGTLEVPAHKSGQKLPAALLIAGSGPTDRNGNDGRLGVTAGTLHVVANILASEGVMSLRFDKYFSGQTGGGRFAGRPGDITLNDFLQQAAAAYNFLHRQPDVDPAKLLIAGHSEGGMYALELANSVNPRPAGLGLLEPQDARLLDLAEVQIDQYIHGAVSSGKMNPSVGAHNAQLLHSAIADFRATGSASAAGMDPSVARIFGTILYPGDAKYVRTDDAIVPADSAAKLSSTTQVLVTDGTDDTNVPPSTMGPLTNALQQAHVGGPGLQLLQGADHYMHLASQADSQPVLAPAAVADIKNWAQAFSPPS